jgi:outer membrane lipase/esterase
VFETDCGAQRRDPPPACLAARAQLPSTRKTCPDLPSAARRRHGAARHATPGASMISFSHPPRRGPRRAALLVLAAALLASCGGGTSQYDPFVPERLFAFGDEASALRSDGRHWAINGVNSTTSAVDCTLQPIWVQQLASLYGFVFTQCNPTNVAEPKARTFAAEGARVADIGAQIDVQIAAGGFSDKDISTLMVGANDIFALYAQYPARSEAALIADAGALGEQAAALVNRLIGLRTKVVVSNLPDLGLSPYALAERAAHTDTDRAALISRLTAAFNQRLGVTIILDGRFVGLVQMDQRSLVIGRSPPSFGFVDITRAACSVALPDCTTATLVTDANASAWLWADDRRLSFGGQNQLATLAIDRARRNPF